MVGLALEFAVRGWVHMQKYLSTTVSTARGDARGELNNSRGASGCKSPLHQCPRAGFASQRGQALLEFALVTPLLLVLLLGVVSYGLYINANVSLQQAARVGARAASLGDATGSKGDSARQEIQAGQNPTVWGVVDDQINQSPGLAGGSGLSMTVTTLAPPQNASPANSLVTVHITDTYKPVVPIPGLLPPSLTLKQSYTMMVE